MIPAPLQNVLDRLSDAWRKRAVALKAASFAAIGVVNSTVDFAVFSFSYYYLGLPIIVANTMAWVVAVTGSYVMNSTITFAAESGRRLAFNRYLAFVLSQVAGVSRQHRHGLVPGRTRPGAGLGREGGGDRGELRHQFLALAFRGIPRAQGRRGVTFEDNLRAKRPNFVTHLECAMTGERHEAGRGA